MIFSDFYEIFKKVCKKVLAQNMYPSDFANYRRFCSFKFWKLFYYWHLYFNIWIQVYLLITCQILSGLKHIWLIYNNFILLNLGKFPLFKPIFEKTDKIIKNQPSWKIKWLQIGEKHIKLLEISGLFCEFPFIFK